MIIPVLIGLIAAVFIMKYVRNRQIDRMDERRERRQDRQEQLLKSLRERKTTKEDANEG